MIQRVKLISGSTACGILARSEEIARVKARLR
jgi:hypothetical protein